MQKKLLVSVVFIAVCFHRAASQQIDTTLNRYASQFNSERIHLHLDRSVYTRDETIYYKAYLLGDNGGFVASKNLYVDFYNEAGILLTQTSSPILQSSAKGSFDIPKEYNGTKLYIRAYTKWMLNFDTAFVYVRTVQVYQPNQQTTTVRTKPKDYTIVRLFPEGGFAVEGLNNRFAFAATDLYGMPVSIKGVLKASDGKQTDSIASLHDGMGSFRAPLQKGLSYSFEWRDDKGNVGIEKIRVDKKSGAVLKIMQQSVNAIVSIERSAEVPASFNIMHLLVHKDYNLWYKFDLNLSSRTFVNLPVNTHEMPSGIVQFTLFDEEWRPVAERVIFVNNKNYSFASQVDVISKDVTKKGKNELEIQVSDTSLANMSMAIADAGAVSAVSDPSVYADFLLNNDLRGFIYDPSYYFSSDVGDSIRALHLDLLMLTHGHRRYDWEKITKAELPTISYPAETDYISLSAQLKNKKLLRTADKLSLNVVVQGKDSVRSVFLLQGNKDGLFQRRNTFYYDTVKLFYNINGKRSIAGTNMFEFKNGLLAADNWNKVFGKKMPAIVSHESVMNDPLRTNEVFFQQQDSILTQKKYKELREVRVSTRVKTKIQVLDNFYTRGVFAGDGSNYKVDVEGDVTARGYISIFYYLQSKLPGLGVAGTPPNVSVTWFKSFSLYGADKSEPSFFLDEVPVSLEAINSIPVSQIAYVKAFRPPFVGAFLNGVNGAIAIYTKKGYSPVYQDTTGGELAKSVLVGYTRFREFTNVDYGELKSTTESDSRATLYWNPYLLTDKFNQKVSVSFYNNDISKQLIVILEGVNLEGKLTRVVKLIE